MLAMVGDRPGYRITFDNGYLEIEMPSTFHEMLAEDVGRIIDSFAFAHNIKLIPVGSVTMRKQALDGGAEADKSFFISSYEAIADLDPLDIDFNVHPVPDLAVEIDLRPPSGHKESVYARLGVAEIWRYDGSGPVRVFRRGETGKYAQAAESVALPGLPLGRLAEILAMPVRERAEAVVAFRRYGK